MRCSVEVARISVKTMEFEISARSYSELNELAYKAAVNADYSNASEADTEYDITNIERLDKEEDDEHT